MFFLEGNQNLFREGSVARTVGQLAKESHAPRSWPASWACDHQVPVSWLTLADTQNYCHDGNSGDPGSASKIHAVHTIIDDVPTCRNWRGFLWFSNAQGMENSWKKHETTHVFFNAVALSEHHLQIPDRLGTPVSRNLLAYCESKFQATAGWTIPSLEFIILHVSTCIAVTSPICFLVFFWVISCYIPMYPI